MENTPHPKRALRSGAADRLQMVSEYLSSGMTRRAFSQEHGVPLATLSWWLRKAKQLKPSAAVDLFQEIRLPGLQNMNGTAWAVEIERGDGVKIRLRREITGEELQGLLRNERC